MRALRTKASPLINVPQIISLAQALVHGEAIEEASAATTVNELPPPAAQASDAIALGNAFAAGAATTLAQAAAAFGPEPGATQVPVPAAQMSSIISGLIRDLAAQPNAAVYASPLVAQTIPALVHAAIAGTVVSASASAPLAALVALVRAAALTSGAGDIPALSQQLRAILSSDPAAIATALISVAPQPANGATALGVIPLYDPSLRSLSGSERVKAKAVAPSATDRPAALVPIPERDPYGRRYSERERRRLFALGRDPRRGFAPEAESAVAAEERWNVTFARSLDTNHDFTDGHGRTWDVVSPHSAVGLEAALRALSSRAGVLLSVAACTAPEREEVVALVARCGAVAAHPIVIVDAQTEVAWPGP